METCVVARTRLLLLRPAEEYAFVQTSPQVLRRVIDRYGACFA